MRNSDQDFFSTMMFGPRPPRQSEPVKQETEAELAPEATDEGNNTSEVDNTSQLVQVIALIQAISLLLNKSNLSLAQPKNFGKAKKKRKMATSSCPFHPSMLNPLVDHFFHPFVFPNRAFSVSSSG